MNEKREIIFKENDKRFGREMLQLFLYLFKSFNILPVQTKRHAESDGCFSF